MRSLCGLKEVKKKVDEEGFTATKAETPAKAASSSTAVPNAVPDRRPVLQVSGGAFACLQDDEEEEEEEVPGFQSQASIYEEKRQKQEEHAREEKVITHLPPPPKPQTVRTPKARRTKRCYMPMRETKEKNDCGCESKKENKNKDEDKTK